MKNKIIYLVLLLLLSTAITPISAQEQCMTELTQVQVDYMNATRQARENFKTTQLKSNTVDPIPMVTHIIRDNNGNGGLTEAELNISLAQLNEAYEPVDFKFELCEINYIDNTAYTSMKKSKVEDFDENDIANAPEEYEMAYINRVEGKVNIFFIEGIEGCGWASFPSYEEKYGKDWMVIRNGCATNGSTLAHEIGHWLNLYHTHQGESGDLGIDVAEAIDGSNCGPNVGDELCDTPADPYLRPAHSDHISANVTSDCIYVGNTNSPDEYNPDVSNIMSYAPKSCRTSFSPQQIDRMQTTYALERENSLSPCTTSLDCGITAISVSNTTTCNDNGTPNDITDDYFKGDVSIYYFEKPTSEVLSLAVQGASILNFHHSNIGDNKHVFTNVRMPANGNPIIMTARFTAQDACALEDVNVHRGMSCYPCYMNPNCDPCNDVGELGLVKQEATDEGFSCFDNLTDHGADDYFEARIRIWHPNLPSTGNLNIEGSVQLSIPVSELYYDNGYYHSPFITFPANGQPIEIKATFDDDNCLIIDTFDAGYPCSPDCKEYSHINISYDISDTDVVQRWDHIATVGSYNILSGGDVTFDAGNFIRLNPGFHAQRGSKFHAYIDGCPDNVSTKEEPLVSDLGATLGSLRNYPNPFTGQTTIEFILTQDTPVTLFVSDVTGKQVAVLLNNNKKTQGTHSVTFDGNNYPAGMYYYTIQAGDLYGTQKMILAK